MCASVQTTAALNKQEEIHSSDVIFANQILQFYKHTVRFRLIIITVLNYSMSRGVLLLF